MMDYVALLLQPRNFLIVIGSASLVGLLTSLALRAFAFRPKKVFEPKVVSDWKRTEHIDFQARDDVMLSEQEDVEAQFVLLVQEKRLVANISGTPTPDIRWRYATKAEAKEIAHMVAMHRQIQTVRASQSPLGASLRELDRSGAGEDAPLSAVLQSAE
jgi:hypothetical protein